MTRRTERVNDLIRTEISNLLLREVKDPRLGGLLTITHVATSPDLRFAKVFFSVMGSEETKKQALQALVAATNFLRKELAQRLSLRYIPKLSFCQDNSIEQGVHLLQLIRQLSPSDQPDDAQQGEVEPG